MNITFDDENNLYIVDSGLTIEYKNSLLIIKIKNFVWSFFSK